MLRLMSSICVVAVTAIAGVPPTFLSEILVNSPGADQGFEAVEIQGDANLSLNGWKLIVIEGDGDPALGTGPAGVVDQIIDLSAFSTGSNGLLLIRDSAANVLLPAPETGTNVVIVDFTPDIENGANTYVLGFGTVPFAVGADLDNTPPAFNDGTLDDLALWANFVVVDAVSYLEDDVATGFEYADDLGGEALGICTGPTDTCTPDIVYRTLQCDGVTPNSWVRGDILGTSPGPFTWDLDETQGWDAVGLTNATAPSPNLGSINFKFCPAAPCPGDINGDNAVDQSDLNLLLASFELMLGEAGYNPDADLTGDDVVDQNDLNIVLANFETVCP